MSTLSRRLEAIAKRIPAPVDPALQPRIIEVVGVAFLGDDRPLELVDPATAAWDADGVQGIRLRFWRRVGAAG